MDMFDGFLFSSLQVSYGILNQSKQITQVGCHGPFSFVSKQWQWGNPFDKLLAQETVGKAQLIFGRLSGRSWVQTWRRLAQLAMGRNETTRGPQVLVYFAFYMLLPIQFFRVPFFDP